MQLTTESVVDPTTTKAWIALHDALVDAVRLITPKELCFKLGITPQYLSEALSGKVSKDGKSRGFKLEWLPVVVSMAPIGAVEALLRALADMRGYEVTRKKVLTQEELRAREREFLQRCAPGVLALMDAEVNR